MLKMNKIGAWRTVAAVLVILGLGIGAAALPGAPQKPSDRETFKVMERVISYIKADYLEEPDPKKVMGGAFQGLINSLDVLSGYLDKSTAAKFGAPNRLQLKDIGAVLYKRPGAFPLVVGLLENSPAAKAGLKIGDYLSAVDNQSTLVWSLTEAVTRLKDAGADKVKLRVIRDNTTQEMDVERAAIYGKPLTLAAQKGTAGIVRIPHLYPALAAEFKKTVLPALQGSTAPLVLDLRDCHEGDNAEAAAFLNIFLKAENIGYFEKKGGAKEALGCPGSPVLESQPLVVWVGPATMGPAEIAAAVLKDQKRAKVIGTATPGLASRQDIFPLEQGDSLVLTTGVFCFPSGEKLWAKGVTPDVKLDLAKTETKDYLEKTLAAAPGR
jgi:carboxyl-terminal processing protease